MRRMGLVALFMLGAASLMAQTTDPFVEGVTSVIKVAGETLSPQDAL